MNRFSAQSHIFLPTLILILGFGIISCSSPRQLQNPTTSATLWVQNAAEYKALTTTVYQSAIPQMDSLLSKEQHTALIDHEQLNSSLPPAIILDVDETVLDNSPFQARLIKNNKSYTPERWNSWVREEKADAIAGALEFTQKAAAKGITIFYLTNRESQVEQATYNNLQALGFPLKEGADILLTKNERPGWTSAKVNRRKYVAENYRVIMLFGDNLNDFLPADDITHEKRMALVDTYRNRFGSAWFVLPNPVYGSWEQALYDFEELNQAQINKRKLQKLNTKN